MPHSLAAIFDLDGTLVDSYDAHFEAWRLVSARHGVAVTVDDYYSHFGRREQARLAHGAAEHLAETAGAGDQLGTAGEGAADRGAEALGEAEGDGVDLRRICRGSDTERDAGIEEPRPIDVHVEAALAALSLIHI